MRTDFGPLASRYDELRPADELWWEMTDLLVQLGDLGGRRVLDVGCGTGRLAAALAERYACRVWGVDPSEEMLVVARERAPRGVTLARAAAERLPFEAGWFERATMTLVVHHLDRPRAFVEIRRVLGDGGRLAFLTFDPVSFDDYYLNRFFPSFLEVDRARFPVFEELAPALRTADFVDVAVHAHDQLIVVDREAALDRIRGRHISTFQLIGEDEYAAGLARAERELPDRLEYPQRWLVVTAEAG